MNLIRTILVAFVVAIIIGAAGLAYAYRQRETLRKERETAALNIKKQDVSVTIIEGKRREEIAAILEEKNITTASQFLLASEGLEGTLFPDTYRFFPDTPASEVVAVLTANFAKKITVKPTKEQLILASIVEREARINAERADIAGVYANRLRIGMKLDADPTVQYAKDDLSYVSGKPFSFWGPITQADYKNVISAYNTYNQPGLPPGPIANPGLQSIEAAMNPTKHDYFYFLHKDGQLFFSKTLQEHVSKQ